MYAALNQAGFEYDIHSLIKAFYPMEDVKLIAVSEMGDYECSYIISIDYADGIDPKAQTDLSGTIGISSLRACDGFKLEHRIPDDSVSAGNVSDIAAEDTDTPKYNSITRDFDKLSRPDLKSLLKRTIYEVISRDTGKTLPWGTLTGIRPTKIPMKMINEGADDSAIADYMKQVYLASDEKVELATRIAHLENGILSNITQNDGYSLYIGIPFCPTTCLYCSFTSYPLVSWHKRVDEYIKTLETELDAVAEQFAGRVLDTIYMGGGTPTTLSPDQFRELIGHVRSRFDLGNLKEFTVEAGRPDSITTDKLRTLKELGVTRISVNPQTMQDKTLKIIGRQHTSAQTIEAFKMAREAGFDNINMDIILGLPGEDEEDVESTLRTIAELKPDSLTVHSMAIKRAAGMHTFLKEHDDIVSSNTPKMMELSMEYAKKMNMLPYYLYRQKNMAGNYENVGYAREGCYGIYNILIMEEVQTIAACGAGTITKRVYGDGRIERCDNVKDVALYIDKIDEMIERKRNLFSTIEC